MNADHILGAVAVACALALFGCASADSAADIDRYTAEALKSSFRDQGIAKVDRLVQDPANRACSEADASGKPLDEKTAREIEVANMKTIRWPADGRFVGDWREGEKIAQNGRGLTWTDAAASAKGPANGGNCYNCHQMSNCLLYTSPSPRDS